MGISFKFAVWKSRGIAIYDCCVSCNVFAIFGLLLDVEWKMAVDSFIDMDDDLDDDRIQAFKKD